MILLLIVIVVIVCLCKIASSSRKNVQASNRIATAQNAANLIAARSISLEEEWRESERQRKADTIRILWQPMSFEVWKLRNKRGVPPASDVSPVPPAEQPKWMTQDLNQIKRIMRDYE